MLSFQRTPRFNLKIKTRFNPHLTGFNNSSFLKFRNFSSPSLLNSKTHQNLKDAFAGESQANRRYLFFASKADIEGHSDIARVFRDTADGETGHANGHLYFLEEVGDPATGLPIGSTSDNLRAAVAGETHEYTGFFLFSFFLLFFSFFFLLFFFSF